MTLTPHAVALARAAEATGRIEQRMLMLRRSGKLREFTSAYKRRRVAAGKRAGVTTPRCTDEVGLAPIFLALSADGFAQRVFRFSQVVDGPLRYGASNRLETMAHSRDRS